MKTHGLDDGDSNKNLVEHCRDLIGEYTISIGLKTLLVLLLSGFQHCARSIIDALRTKIIILNQAERKHLATAIMVRIRILDRWGLDCGGDFAQAIIEIGDKSFAPKLEEAGYPVHAKWLEGDIPSLISIAKNDEFEQRIVAIEALGELSAIQAVEPLTKMLESNNGLINVNATKALGKIGSVKAVGPLLMNLIQGRSFSGDITCEVIDKLLGENWRHKIYESTYSNSIPITRRSDK